MGSAMRKRYVAVGILMLAAAFRLSAEALTVEETKAQALQNQYTHPDDIMLSNLPIAYGDEAFRQRINERTGGNRTPIGLVLSGGSARAMAHIGVLRYLEEHDIVPDFIISNSMGSIVAMLYSAGMSPDQIEEMITKVDMSKTIDFTLPLDGGLLRTDTLSALISNVVGPDLRLEDLPIPILVVQEDLVTKRQILVSEGDFATVLRASFAIPVYFSPEYYQGHLLIDGGVTNLAPIDVAYRYSDQVIVSTTFQTVDTLNLRNPLTALNVMLDMSKRRTGVAEMEEHPDMIWLRCKVEDTSFMDFGALPSISKKGYEAAQAQAEALAALPKGEDVSSLSEARTRLSASVDTTLGNFYLYDRVYQPRLVQMVGPSFHSFYTDDQAFLYDAQSMGISYRSRWTDFAFQGQGGFDFRSMASGDMEIAPSLMGKLDFYMKEHTRFTFLANLAWEDGLKPTFYFRQSIETRWKFLNEQLDLRGQEIWEILAADHESHFPTSTMMLSLGGKAIYHPKRSDWVAMLDGSNVQQAFQVYGDFDETRTLFYLRLNTVVDPLPLDFFVTFDQTLRVAMDGKENVPYFARDGFRTGSSKVLAHGHDMDDNNTGDPALYEANLVFGWKPSVFKPSLAELILLKDTSIGWYTDMLVMDGDWDFSFGVQLSSTPSFLGMKDLPLTTYVGYDTVSDSVIWGLYFSGVVD